ncbi:response regulator transcription factor [Paenibacillus caui]|uniref:response regulator transcription factor n=1 Tax=Paenibacillus caui TaxID=2873927 RepID=UPI001CA9D4DB|nr:response regulator transcription factor [Paenibacillus caui]
MPHTITAAEEHEDHLHHAEDKLRKSPGARFGLMYIYAANAPSYLESQIVSLLETKGDADFEVWRDSETGCLAVMLPGLALDQVHFRGLLLKQQLQERISDLHPHITLASFPEQGEPDEEVFRQMANLSRTSLSEDIHIFTKVETEHSAPGRILVVDNDAGMREFLQIRLRMHGYETREAEDGLAALELIETWQPDLVLTELNLYGIDGLPYIHQIRQLKVKEPPKIVVLTEQRVEQTISRCFEYGVNDYMTKPFSPVELDARIRRCFY